MENDVQVSFEDAAGVEEAKQELVEIIDFLKEPERFTRVGGQIPRGILMAATNRPEILDPALLRPGRFDRQILVDRPDKQGRMAILEVHLKKVTAADNLDVETIAGMTPGMVGADLANLRQALAA